ncbi:glycoside hydrolase family 43 protein [Bifidobacterium felsineum]|uniref:Glycosyl hydrolase family 43 n=1 Tax=Bifidobacterium felsineum TaxID=2045440 RepID=A0A2M9HI21_9BIFI|nr:glycoside hydrolase family 43 protein [Bifidobacterium felsineum]MBT1164738.1 family 43 glycosylhydrolase [Bifidobacterium felsineum]PJM76474.1 hypothetical protein CSQ86_09070 [Bifidobacterium felsineum]
MRNQDITIRDPYVITHDGKYYMYGTRSFDCWGPMDGWDVYVSDDLENWSEPHEIYHREPGFWADQNYWAPECYERDGEFRLITTLGCSDGRKKGIYLLVSDSPLGPFHFVSRLTPEDEECIDGTVYEENGKAYVVYSHTLEDVPEGDMCARELSSDWRQPVGEGFRLFSAVDAKWNSIVPFAASEFGIEGDAYFSDGPCLYKMEDGTLVMLWSSWGEGGYSVGLARSDNGSILGTWSHDDDLLVADGGHGMLFRTLEGELRFALHVPNTFYKEHPFFAPVEEHDGKLTIDVTAA